MFRSRLIFNYLELICELSEWRLGVWLWSWLTIDNLMRHNNIEILLRVWLVAGLVPGNYQEKMCCVLWWAKLTPPTSPIPTPRGVQISKYVELSNTNHHSHTAECLEGDFDPEFVSASSIRCWGSTGSFRYFSPPPAPAICSLQSPRAWAQFHLRAWWRWQY